MCVHVRKHTNQVSMYARTHLLTQSHMAHTNMQNTHTYSNKLVWSHKHTEEVFSARAQGHAGLMIKIV